MFKTNRKKFKGGKFVWLTRDNVKGYDQEIMVWISKNPPTIDPRSGLYSRRHIQTNGKYTDDFIVIDIDIFENICGLKLDPSQRIKARFQVEILS